MPSNWERVDADPALLNAARRRYAGGGDIADQLWWIDHPGTPGPSGAQDPAAAVESARTALYRPGTDPDSAAEVGRAAAAIRHDREEALLALRAAEAARPRAAEPAPTGPVRQQPARVLAGVILAALLFGGVSGLAIGRYTRTATPAALAVFDRAQQQDDRPPTSASLPSFVSPSTTRLIGTSTTTGASLYGAKATDGRICLIAIVLAKQFLATCVSEAAFAVSGLTLALEVSVDPEDDSGVNRPRELTPTWSPDGALTF